MNKFCIEYLAELIGRRDLHNAHVIEKKRVWAYWTITTYRDPVFVDLTNFA